MGDSLVLEIICSYLLVGIDSGNITEVINRGNSKLDGRLKTRQKVKGRPKVKMVFHAKKDIIRVALYQNVSCTDMRVKLH